jgi:hypothetical protein
VTAGVNGLSLLQWTDGYGEMEGLKARIPAMTGGDGAAAWSWSLGEG